jgi:hypothetical protein
LPFGGKDYNPSDLPRTSEGSFRATTEMSDLMTAKVERPSVAEYEPQTVVPATKAKPERIAKRKKAVAQKRRPAQVNQMTAATQPTPAQPEPNLPPPPILFFLGAPPPAAQPAQPVQAAPAPAAPAAAPPSPPPANNSWVPNSISDAFKNAY